MNVFSAGGTWRATKFSGTMNVLVPEARGEPLNFEQQ